MRWKGASAAGVRPTLAREALAALSATAAVGLATGLAATALAARINPSLRDPRDAALFLLLGMTLYPVLFAPLGLWTFVCVRWVGFRPHRAAAPEEPPADARGLDRSTDPRAKDATSRFPFSTHALVMLCGVAAYALAVAVCARYASWSEGDSSTLAFAVGAALLACALAACVATRSVFQRLIGPRRWLAPIVLLFLGGLFVLLGIGGSEVGRTHAAADVEVLGGTAHAVERTDPALAALPAPRQHRVVLLALDGADRTRIDALIAAGELPAFERLLAGSVSTPLRGERPSWSAVAWTTIATGLPPREHGVCDVTELSVPGLSRGLQRLYERHGQPPLLPAGLGLRPLVDALLDRLLAADLVREHAVSSTQRRAKAVWNILSERGLPVTVVGWPASRPAESLFGWVVADDDAWTADLRRPAQRDVKLLESGLFAPDALREEIADLLESLRAGEVLQPVAATAPARPQPEEDEAPGAAVAEAALPVLEDRAAGELAWLANDPELRREAREVLASDAFASRVALRLWRERRPRFLALCLRGIDGVGNRLTRTPEALDGMYRWMDQVLAAWIDAAGAEATLVVVSAFGRSSEEDGHPGDGLLVLRGADVRPGVEFGEPPSILDIAPTLLALYGLPSSSEMPGRALLEVLEVDARPAPGGHPPSYGPYSVRAAAGPAAAVAGARAAQTSDD